MTVQSALVRHRLANGLRVVLLPDPQVPVVSLAVNYAVGSAHERPGRTGFAHLFEHMMFQGSANVGKTEHLRDVQSMGGMANAYTTWDSTHYINTVPSHQLPVVLWMEADRMATLADAITQESLDNQCEVVKNERRARVDNVPYGSAEEQLFSMALPPGHPYGHTVWGLMADLEAASLDDVRQFFAAFYVPNNAVVVLTGDFEPREALELVDRYFGPIAGGPDPQPLGGAVPLELDGAIRAEKADEVPTPRLFMACRVEPFGTEAWDVADVAVDVLNRGRAARLQRRLIRELRLADEVDAAVYLLAGGVSLLEIDVGAAEGVEPSAIDAALAEELDRLATEPPDADEMHRVRVGRATGNAVMMQSQEARAGRIGTYASVLDEPERFGQEEERDLVVTAEKIADFARGPLSAANRVSLWYLPS